MRYLLDTNIVSDLVRRPQGRIAQRIAEIGETEICTSIIVAAELRGRLEPAGQPLGGNDLFIAAQTVALGYTLVTDNEREFARISELSIENWLR